MHFSSKPEDYFSDHVLLGAALSASLAAEIVLSLRTVKLTPPGWPLIALRSGEALCCKCLTRLSSTWFHATPSYLRHAVLGCSCIWRWHSTCDCRIDQMLACGICIICLVAYSDITDRYMDCSYVAIILMAELGCFAMQLTLWPWSYTF